MNYPYLFSDRHRITLIDCQVKSDAVIARLSWFAPYLDLGMHELKENAITPICKILLPDWAISDEPLVFLEPIQLELYRL